MGLYEFKKLYHFIEFCNSKKRKTEEKAKKSPFIDLCVPEKGWKCVCGRGHYPYESGCVCGITKAEAKKQAELRENRERNKQTTKQIGKPVRPPMLLSYKEVKENFVELFVVDPKPYDVERAGIWKSKNQPVIINEYIDGHFSIYYYVVRWLSFKEVQDLAKSVYDRNSAAKHFLNISETNWRKLLQKVQEEK